MAHWCPIRPVGQRLGDRIAVRTALFVAALALSGAALAQPFPSRPVKIVVPTTPGGATDALSRSIGARLSEIWGQPVVGTTIFTGREGNGWASAAPDSASAATK